MLDAVHCEGGEWGNEEAATVYLTGWGRHRCCERYCAGALVVSVPSVDTALSYVVVVGCGGGAVVSRR